MFFTKFCILYLIEKFLTSLEPIGLDRFHKNPPLNTVLSVVNPAPF
jgi:hypothetical protein